MTAIRGAARSINPLLVRQPPKPISTKPADVAELTKADAKPAEADVVKGPRFRSAAVQAHQSPKLDAPPAPPIAPDPPTPPLDIEIQKALETAYQSFQESGGGNAAELGRALYDSVWEHLESIGESNTPVKSANAVMEFLHQLKPDSLGSNPVRGANAGANGLTELDNTPSVDSAFGPNTHKIGARGIDIRI